MNGVAGNCKEGRSRGRWRPTSSAEGVPEADGEPQPLLHRLPHHHLERGRQSEQSKQLTRAEGSPHLLRIVVFEAQHLFGRRIWLVLDLANTCEGAASPCESGCLLGEHVSATAPGKNSWLSCTTFSPRRGLLAAGANEDMTTRSMWSQGPVAGYEPRLQIHLSHTPNVCVIWNLRARGSWKHGF